MKKRFTEEQIIGFLREADAGMPVKDLCRKHGFSEASYYLWRSKFGGMSVSDAKRLKELEAENARLKKLLAESDARKRGDQGGPAKKVVTAPARRELVRHMVDRRPERAAGVGGRPHERQRLALRRRGRTATASCASASWRWRIGTGATASA